MLNHSRSAVGIVVLAVAGLPLVAIRAQSTTASPTFDVVSIKRNTSGASSGSMSQSTGGGLTLVNGPVTALISSAYPEFPSPQGLPDWAWAEAPTSPVPGSFLAPCTMHSSGNRLEGDYTLPGLAGLLRTMAGRPVVDKTGLSGYYRVKLEAANMFMAPTKSFVIWTRRVNGSTRWRGVRELDV